MKKLLVALTMAVFVVGLAVPAVAVTFPEPACGPNGYHEVYEFDFINRVWVPIPALLRECEMFSKLSNVEQYRFESDAAAAVCSPDYLNPEAEPPVQKTIYNRLHLFPWIDIHFNQTELIWDVFKPGNYMAKAFVIALAANCDVHIHFGEGTFDVPDKLVDGQENGHIGFREETKGGPAVAIGDKERQGSLLGKEAPGTPPDVVDVWWWWVQGSVEDWDAPHIMTGDGEQHAYTVPDKDNIVTSPHGPFPLGWVPADLMNCDFTIVRDILYDGIAKLHFGKYIVFYEYIHVEPCDSEGKYLDDFVITIFPDP